ncbi:MAG: bifunctional phosphoribosylaminoimidazolecarboxamide formyltransferase/IMP cyclohydrolase [Bacteroidota bacterium]
MQSEKKIESALISVYYKENLDKIVTLLHRYGVRLYSTGGTQSFIEGLGLPVTSVESLTSYPSILGGRVKTLHPKVFGGILARREEKSDLEQLSQYEIPEIDLVIVDLYPFEATVASGADHQQVIEKIDIGGISLIRAAAKNYKDVVILASRSQYAEFAALLEEKKGHTSIDDRRKYAREAFQVSSHYDSAIFNYFDRGECSALKISETGAHPLRYGENPHQKGVFFGDFEKMFTQLHGKEISYNNLLDIDAAVGLINEFEEPTFAILKHNNTCGIASRASLADAWRDALAGDPVSAYGGVVIANREIDTATAEEMNKLFFEISIAPGYSDAALEILKQKKNRIILIQTDTHLSPRTVRTILNGVIMQERDMATETAGEMKAVTLTAPSEEQLADLVFANKVVKHTKSNAIVLAKNKQLQASGVGQTSRVDALKQAIEKARSFGFNLEDAVMASDAFFPFADSVEIAHQAGITAVVQPGGSVRDQETIDYCNQNKVSMVFTGIRHFKH